MDTDARQMLLRRLSLIIDALMLPFSMLLGFGLQELLQPLVPALKEPPRAAEYAMLLSLTVPVWTGLVVALGLHRTFERTWSRVELVVDLGKLHGLGFLAISTLAFLTQSRINRSVVALFLLVNFAISSLARGLVRLALESRYRSGELRRSWLLVGAPSAAMVTCLRAAQAESFAPRLVGVLSVGPSAFPELPVIGTPDEIERILHAESIDLVLFFPPLHHHDVAGLALRACERQGIQTAFVVGAPERYPVAPRVITVGELPCLSFDWVPARPDALAAKHAVDFVIAVIGLIATAPLLAIISALIAATMGRPVLFRQERIGLHGRRFWMLKFRTMKKGAEAQRAELAEHNEMTGPVFKMTVDPRVTRLGGILRRWSLDELPQLLNVVLGDMSLVGPRPLPSAEQQEIEGWYRRRLSMKPGITGLWQVSGRSNVDFDRWMQLDLRYIDQWSLRLDLTILLKTLPAVLFRRGAK